MHTTQLQGPQGPPGDGLIYGSSPVPGESGQVIFGPADPNDPNSPGQFFVNDGNGNWVPQTVTGATFGRRRRR